MEIEISFPWCFKKSVTFPFIADILSTPFTPVTFPGEFNDVFFDVCGVTLGMREFEAGGEDFEKDDDDEDDIVDEIESTELDCGVTFLCLPASMQ